MDLLVILKKLHCPDYLLERVLSLANHEHHSGVTFQPKACSCKATIQWMYKTLEILRVCCHNASVSHLETMTLQQSCKMLYNFCFCYFIVNITSDYTLMEPHDLVLNVHHDPSSMCNSYKHHIVGKTKTNAG